MHALSLGLPRGASGRATLLWANGIVIKTSPYAPTDSVSAKYLESELPLDHVEFAEMATFEKERRIPETEIVFSFLDVSRHTLFGPFSKYLATLK